MKASDFKNLLCSDLFKIGKMKSVYIVPVFMFLLLLLNYSVLWLMGDTSAGATIPDGFTTPLYTGRYMLMSAGANINITLFIGILCGIFIGGEFRDGTIKIAIARGKNRVLVYFSKWLTMLTLTIGYILGAFLLSGLLTAFTGYGFEFNGTELALLARSLAIQCYCATAICSVYVCVAFLTRNPGSAVGISIGLTIGVNVVVAVLMLVIGLMITNKDLFQAVYTIIMLIPSQQIAYAAQSDSFTVTQIMQITFGSLAFIAASSALGVLTFKRRDIR